MNNRIFTLLVLCTIAITATRCKKTDLFQSDQVADYVNLQPGKYIIYRLDSITRVPFTDTATVVSSYQAKDVVDSTFIDNLGRPGRRIIRFLRGLNSNNEGDWQPTMTYLITPTRETLEVVENNLRFQKLKLPLTDDFNWKGNTYIETYSTDINWQYRFLDDWDYTYSNVGEPFIPFTTAVDSTITVNQQDEVLGTPGNLDSYSERTFAKEVYGKGIGMIYKEFTHWVFQPKTTVYPAGYVEGYSIKLRMTAHN